MASSATFERSRRAAAGRAELLANGAVDMEHGLEIENVGRRGPLSTAVTWPSADGPSVDLGESFPTHIFFQILASIQLRTSLVKFARSPRTDPPGQESAV